jgi:hypothetical protein
MPQDIRLWEITSEETLREISRSRLDLEKRIENWLESDISILSNDLLVIGRQVPTDFGGVIDLLCLDYAGDLVIVELKRDKTPREITAQALDYASWVKDLSNERIREISSKYLGDQISLEEAFSQKFGEEEVPDVLNEQHKILIVASEIDSSSERIINYLSNTYGVSINAVTFQYYRDQNGKELLARAFLIEPSEVEYKTQTKSSSKRRPNLTYEELEAIADNNNVGDLYKRLIENVGVFFDQRAPTRSTVAFIGVIDGSRNTIFSLLPGESNQTNGVRFSLYIERLMKYLDVEKEVIKEILPVVTEEEIPYKNAPLTLFGFFKNNEEVDNFIDGLSGLKKK